MSPAWLFPGQGSQAVGMGRDLAEAHPEARAVFEAADRALDLPLSRYCFQGPEEELRRTAITQPALLTTSVAAARVLEKAGHAPRAVAGHSLGEYSALVVAGVLAFDDAVRAVHQRGRLMQEAVPEGEGAMAALIGMEAGAVADLCQEAAAGAVLAPANLNAPGQVVIAGHRAAVERAVEAARGKGARRAVFLNVSAPFHCPLMEPAARGLEKVLASIPFTTARVPVWTNVDAAPSTDGEALRRALVRQVASPVRWEESIRAMGEAGHLSFLEVGPGTVLAGLVRRILPEASVAPAGTADALAKVAGAAP